MGAYRQYLIEKDFFTGVKAGEFSVYDQSKKKFTLSTWITLCYYSNSRTRCLYKKIARGLHSEFMVFME